MIKGILDWKRWKVWDLLLSIMENGGGGCLVIGCAVLILMIVGFLVWALMAHVALSLISSGFGIELNTFQRWGIVVGLYVLAWLFGGSRFVINSGRK